MTPGALKWGLEPFGSWHASWPFLIGLLQLVLLAFHQPGFLLLGRTFGSGGQLVCLAAAKVQPYLSVCLSVYPSPPPSPSPSPFPLSLKYENINTLCYNCQEQAISYKWLFFDLFPPPTPSRTLFFLDRFSFMLFKAIDKTFEQLVAHIIKKSVEN